MSNSPVILKELAVRCSGRHSHQHLTENRAKECENYPLDLINAILDGIAKTADMKDAIVDMNTSAWNMTLSMHAANPAQIVESPTLPKSVLPCDDGSEIPITWDAEQFRAM